MSEVPSGVSQGSNDTESVASPEGPLSGLVVLDFTTNVAGAFSTLVLADQGADVIKIERPITGDDSRHMAPVIGNTSAPFMALNRNKRSVVLDLRTEDGLQVAKDLAARADVLIENMRPGKLASLGLDFEGVRKLREDIVYCSMSGFGQTGPLSQRPAYDVVIQARTGIMSITGEAGRQPVRIGPSIVDLSTGMWAAIAVTSALWKRATLGTAQLLDVSMFEVGLTWMNLPIAQYAASGELPVRMGGQSPLSVPTDIYPTDGGDSIVVAMFNDSMWRQLCAIDEFKEFADVSEFATNAGRVRERDRITKDLRAIFAKHRAEFWLSRLQERGIPCDLVQELDKVVNDPQAHARGAFVQLSSAECDRPLLGASIPIRNNNYARRTTHSYRAPAFGEHTQEVLKELYGKQ
jgi:crotonobetainyl-CoA:carnitine CoA-transferase CaiB-like acyl-CoA transferase